MGLNNKFVVNNYIFILTIETQVMNVEELLLTF
jgi:hypothetical protein